MAYNKAVEKFRDQEYPMMQGKVYLDHGGTTIYARSLIEQSSDKMISNLYGNPHSASDPALLSSRVVKGVREAALTFFGADPEHFDLVFTANATAAIKIVADTFQDLALANSDSGRFWYGYHKDAHTSLVGVREVTGGTHQCFQSDEEVELWLDGAFSSTQSGEELPGLFAFPGQSNMTGRRLPLSWTQTLRSSLKQHHQNTYSLLDAAALATTTQLDFSDPECAPDFTVLSFYKIFGYPDLGALIVRKKSGHILSWKRYFGGGTISWLTVLREPTFQRKDATIHEGLEDGTLPFHNIMTLGCAIEVHKSLYGSMNKISLHTTYLSEHLYLGMKSLRHLTGVPVCVMYNEEGYGDSKRQGATIAFNVVKADRTYIGHTLVEKMANEKCIYVRSGGLCNPGGNATYLEVEPWQYKRARSAGFRCGGENPSLAVINNKPTGVVRVSLGAMSTLADVEIFLEFMRDTFEERHDAAKETTGSEDHQSLLSELGAAARKDEDNGPHFGESESECNLVLPLAMRMRKAWNSNPKPQEATTSSSGQPASSDDRIAPPSQTTSRTTSNREVLQDRVAAGESARNGHAGPAVLQKHDKRVTKSRSILKFLREKR